MYGLAAIQQANGWAMAGAGACIVLSGLAVLAFLISLLPKLISRYEKTPSAPAETPTPESETERPAPPSAGKTVELDTYISLTEELGEAFTLIDLHRKSRAAGLPHPHMSIKQFRESGRLVSVGDDRFAWQPHSD